MSVDAAGSGGEVFAAARQHPRAASPLLSPWTHCLPSPPLPSPHTDPGWQQFLLAGIAAR